MLQNLQNVRTLLTRPSLALPYLKYIIISKVFGLKPTRKLAGDIKIGSFVNFSEYHSCSRAVSTGELKFLQQFAFETGAIVDIGANLGLYTIVLAQRNPQCRVYSFEPHPAVFNALSDNIKLNDLSNVTAEKLAIGKTNGSVKFFANSHSRATSRLADRDQAGAICVKVVSLDNYMSMHHVEQVSFMKVDVEGFESLVFQGAKELLAGAKIRAIFFEVCPDASLSAGFNPTDAAKILSDYGYRLHRINDAGGLLPVKLEEAEHEIVTNWVALPPCDQPKKSPVPMQNGA